MVSSFFLRSASLSLPLLLAQQAAAVTSSTYALDTSYEGADFFDGFEFYTAADPTNGFVTYVDESTALSDGLISSGDGQPAIMSVDDTTTLATDGSDGGRKSVRISSTKSYTHGLFIGDFGHMPGGICGTWPAFWTFGPNWPTNGEIDIIEGVNSATTNLMSLHTSPNCTIAGANQLGTLQTSDCDTSVNYNSGCGVTADTTESYGTGFNNIGGGVYAMQWTSDYIRIWFFARGSIPSDITAETPDPSGWGEPQANLQGSCDIDSHFADHNIIFDTTFCGDYGNAVWSSDSTCSAKASTCNEYVAQNPSAFADAYWSVNSVKVYQLVSSDSTSSSSSSSSITSVAAASSVAAPGMGNTTSVASTSLSPEFNSTSSASYAVATATGNPSAIGDYEYYGCYGSSSNFTSFNLIATESSMSNDRCVSLCSGSPFAGTYQNSCYCGSSVDNSTTPVSSESCNIPCPGSSGETCGGNSTTTLSRFRRAVPNTYLLSLYIYVAGSSSSAAVATTSAAAGVSVSVNIEISATTSITTSTGSITAAHYITAGSSSLSSVSPAYQTIGYGMGGGATAAATVITTTYVDVCPTGLATYTLTSTVNECGCTRTKGASSVEATIAMTTTEKVCTACAATGGPSTVTVTVPASSVAASTTSSESTSESSAAATIAGAVTTVQVAAGTGAAVAYVGSSSNGTAAATAVPYSPSSTPSYAVYTGDGETLAASGVLCAAVALAALIL
ncbi:hypothetical protein UCRPC4_g05620 [Phaeomoniella chlamydospora]|uniref:endo-1,3(4)-beta-glucanase n=1 Tax=Phaeomoniella chlamydospora TaxID=158046 RepID=A0A0G2E4X9_PHACM|nr:hypothetical protein UCRPC4_g05620 [Phaeomoniella chlamydospora]